MKKMIYISKNNKEIVFEDWCDQTDCKDEEWYSDYWVYMCKECYEKYKNELVGITKSESSSEEPLCSVDGCSNKNEYYIDFYKSKNIIEFREI